MTDYPVKHITTHKADAFKRLLTQYSADRAPNLRSIVGANADQWQQLEDAFWDLLTKRGLPTAFGAQLDVLGKLVGQPRNGNDDPAYLAFIYIRIAEINSQGTPEELIHIYSSLFGNARIQYDEYYPAYFELTALQGFPILPVAQINAIIVECKPAGVGFWATWSGSDDPLVFAGDPSGDGLGGVYANFKNTGLGGNFSGVI